MQNNLNLKNEKEAESCWVCSSPKCLPYRETTKTSELTDLDLVITSKEYGNTLPLLKCTDCGMIFASSPELSNLEDLYSVMSDNEYIVSIEQRRLQMRALLKEVLKASPNSKSLLDIGTGAGALLAEAESLGIKSIGYEISHFLCQYGKNKLKVNIIEKLFPSIEIKDEKFDLIFLVDVIEHVSQPLELVKQAKKYLSEKGKIIIVTPDVDSLIAKALGKRWWHFRLAHVSYFNKKTLTLLAANAGLTPCSFFYPGWYFKLGHIFSRITQYLPWLKVFKTWVPFKNYFTNRVVPLNFFDSLGFIFSA